MKKIQITEEMHLENEWFKEAKNIKINDLPAFIDRILNQYEHDYGTACHAVAACAVAAAWSACDKEGLTGYQAGFVMWDFIRNWTKSGNECGLRLTDYDDMLFPQYSMKFDKTISKDTWEAIQKKAKELLSENEDEYVHPKVLQHWKSIADGEVPFGYRVSQDDLD